MTPGRILVPLDGSDLGERALPIAGQIARRANAEVVLFRAPLARAFTSMDALEATRAEAIALSEAQAYLEDICARVSDWGFRCQVATPDRDKDRSDPALEQVVRPVLPFRQVAEVSREAAEAISRAVKYLEIDLVVMGTHGRSGLGRWVYGSVAMDVLRQSSAPVLLVRSGTPDALPEGDDLRILVALDGTPASEAGLVAATDLALLFGGSLVLLRVVPAPQTAMRGLLLGPLVTDPTEHRALQEAARSSLDELRSALGERGVEAETVIEEGDVAMAVARVARQRECALTAITAHGRSGFARLAIGSADESIISSVSTPVLVARAPDDHHEAALPIAGDDEAEDTPEDALLPATPSFVLRLTEEERQLLVTALVSLQQMTVRDEDRLDAIRRVLERLEQGPEATLAAVGDR